MVFNSYEFVLLLMPLFMAGLYIVRRLGDRFGDRELFCNVFIIAGSLCFYGLFGAQNLAVLFMSIIWNICTAIPMGFIRDREELAAKANAQAGKEAQNGVTLLSFWMTFGIAGNLALLLFFKLSGIFFPIAISFYTFNQISYIVDLKRGDIEEFRPISYLTYVLFFPKLLQGPIVRYNDFAVGMEKVYYHEPSWEKIMRGLLLFAIGLFKKVILADTFGGAVDFAYESISSLSGLEAILTAVFYSFQLYFDFSGYCDMAGGVCTVMGYDIALNFDSPYKAVNILDFWKRWHITLTKFFTRYLYIPLGGNRKGVVRTYINLMIVFLVSGFWHGTGWSFIVWGAMHGILYCITRAAAQYTDKSADKVGKANIGNPVLSTVIRGGKIALTFVYVTVAWVFFRANTVADALALLTRVFTGGFRPLASNGMFLSSFSSAFLLDELWYVIKVTPLMKFNFVWDICLWLFFVVAFIMIFFCKNAQQISKECKIGIGTTLLTAFLIVWCVVSFGGVSTFLYMNF